MKHVVAEVRFQEAAEQGVPPLEAALRCVCGVRMTVEGWKQHLVDVGQVVVNAQVLGPRTGERRDFSRRDGRQHFSDEQLRALDGQTMTEAGRVLGVTPQAVRRRRRLIATGA